MMEDDEMYQEIFNTEVARELMREVNPDVSDAEVEQVYELCNGNPWDAGLLYAILIEAEDSRITK